MILARTVLKWIPGSQVREDEIIKIENTKEKDLVEEAHLPSWEMWICTTSLLVSLSHIFGFPGCICHCPLPANQGDPETQFQCNLRDLLNIKKKEVRDYYGGETRIPSSRAKDSIGL